MDPMILGRARGMSSQNWRGWAPCLALALLVLGAIPLVVTLTRARTANAASLAAPVVDAAVRATSDTARATADAARADAAARAAETSASDAARNAARAATYAADAARQTLAKGDGMASGQTVANASAREVFSAAMWRSTQRALPGRGGAPSATRDPQVCFIVRAMPSHITNLPALVFSILASGYPSVRVFLLRTFSESDPAAEDFHVLADYINAALPEPLVEVSPLTSDVTDRDFPGIARDYSSNSPPTGDGGYPVTDLLIEQIIAKRAGIWGRDGPATWPFVNYGFCDAIVVTNGDNLYANQFLPAIVAQLDKSHLVGTWFVSRYTNTEALMAAGKKRGRVGGPTRIGRDYEFNASFTVGGIDLGAAAVRTDALAMTGVRFVIDRLRKDPSGKSIDFVNCDGLYFQKLVETPDLGAVILERTLFVHQ